jgi:hypothetical protein
MPVGPWKRAALPAPSVLPLDPALPATVVVTPDAITTCRTVLLPVSETNRFTPLTASPAGFLNRALVPVASVEPLTTLVLPARVVTTPVEITTLRIE